MEGSQFSLAWHFPVNSGWSEVISLSAGLKTGQGKRNTAKNVQNAENTSLFLSALKKMFTVHSPLKQWTANSSDILPLKGEKKISDSDNTREICRTQTFPLERKERERSQIWTCWILNGFWCSSAVSVAVPGKPARLRPRCSTTPLNLPKPTHKMFKAACFFFRNKYWLFNKCMRHLYTVELLLIRHKWVQKF